MNLLLIYAEFFKVGLFAVGGGLATLPFIFQMADDRFTFITQTGWIDRETVGNFYAFAQSMPGPIGVNNATLVGFRYAGIGGSLFAALGLITPAVIIILIIARIFQAFKQNRIVTSVFSGLRPAAGGLLAAAALGIWKLSLYNANSAHWYKMLRWKETAVFAALYFVIRKFRVHPAVYIAIGAAAGIALGF